MDTKDATRGEGISNPAMDPSKIEKDAERYSNDAAPQTLARRAWKVAIMRQPTPPRDARSVSLGKVLAFILLLMIAAYNACHSPQLRDMLGPFSRKVQPASPTTAEKPNFVGQATSPV